MYISLFAKRTNKKTTAELFKFIAGTPIPGLVIKINYPRFHPQFLLHVVGHSATAACWQRTRGHQTIYFQPLFYLCSLAVLIPNKYLNRMSLELTRFKDISWDIRNIEQLQALIKFKEVLCLKIQEPYFNKLNTRNNCNCMGSGSIFISMVGTSTNNN